MKNLFLLISFVISSFSVNADDSHSAVDVSKVWARATPPGVGTSAIYMTISNHTRTTLKLVGVNSDVTDRIELHNTTNKDGMMKMRQIDGIDLDKQTAVELKPHGMHVMLFDLKTPLEAGTSFDAELVFNNGKSISIEIPVMKMAMDDDHSKMKSQKHEHK